MKQHKLVSFEQFQKSKMFVNRQDSDILDNWDLDCKEAIVYGGVHGQWGYIELQTVHHLSDDGAHPMRIFYLTLECSEFYSTHLQDLEMKLYEYMMDIGNLDPSPSEMRGRLQDIVNDGLNAFWEVVAEAYPECNTGDLGPTATMDFLQSALKVVTTWRDNNGGGQNVNP